MQTELENKLVQIFQLVLDLDGTADVTNLRRINEVKWDSLAHVTLVTALESEFGINIDYTEADRLSSYKSVLLLLREKNVPDVQ